LLNRDEIKTFAPFFLTHLKLGKFKGRVTKDHPVSVKKIIEGYHKKSKHLNLTEDDIRNAATYLAARELPIGGNMEDGFYYSGNTDDIPKEPLSPPTDYPVASTPSKSQGSIIYDKKRKKLSKEESEKMSKLLGREVIYWPNKDEISTDTGFVTSKKQS
jgi:hypothetical protein